MRKRFFGAASAHRRWAADVPVLLPFGSGVVAVDVGVEDLVGDAAAAVCEGAVAEAESDVVGAGVMMGLAGRAGDEGADDEGPADAESSELR